MSGIGYRALVPKRQASSARHCINNVGTQVLSVRQWNCMNNISTWALGVRR